MVNIVTFLGFKGERSPQSPPLDPTLCRVSTLFGVSASAFCQNISNQKQANDLSYLSDLAVYLGLPFKHS